jgi:hypothetical protein
MTLVPPARRTRLPVAASGSAGRGPGTPAAVAVATTAAAALPPGTRPSARDTDPPAARPWPGGCGRGGGCRAAARLAPDRGPLRRRAAARG